MWSLMFGIRPTFLWIFRIRKNQVGFPIFGVDQVSVRAQGPEEQEG